MNCNSAKFHSTLDREKGGKREGENENAQEGEK